MKIKVNGIEKNFEEIFNLSSFIMSELNCKDTSGIAIALNYKIIQKQKWDTTDIKDNDEIEIVTAVQGG